jgi:hypothetical protein
MKKIFFITGIIFIAANAISQVAQFRINLVLNSTPPANLSEWANRSEVLTLIISSPAAITVPVKIKTEIKTTDGTVIGATDLVKAATYTISQSTTLFYATDVLPLENMLFTGKYKSSLQRSGKLPSDNYIICVQLIRPTDYIPVSDLACKNFYLATTQLPILMKPYNEEILDGKIAQTAITFRWSPVIPRLTEPITYRLQVFEVLPFQTPMQALRSNQPLLDREIRSATQFIWQPQLSSINAQNYAVRDSLSKDEMKEKRSGKTVFIWTIQSLNTRGLPVTQSDGNGEARSEPMIFYVDPKKSNATKK